MHIYYDNTTEGLIVENLWCPAKPKIDKGKEGFINYGDGTLGHIDEENSFTVKHIMRDTISNPTYFTMLSKKAGYEGMSLYMLFIGEIASYYSTKYYPREKLRDDMAKELAYWLSRKL